MSQKQSDSGDAVAGMEPGAGAAGARPGRTRAAWAVFGVGLFVAWATAFSFLPLGCFVWLPAIGYLLWRRRRRLALVLFALSPIALLSTLSLTLGLVGYFTGHGRLQTFGMPSQEFYNLDREYRCYWSTSGCIVTGIEPFLQTPNNLVLRGLIRGFGPMRGAYTGAYPTREEAQAALQDAAPLTREALQSGELSVAGRSVRLNEYARHETKTMFEGAEPLRATLYRGDCLLVGGSTRHGDKSIAAIALSDGDLFAKYFVFREK